MPTVLAPSESVRVPPVPLPFPALLNVVEPRAKPKEARSTASVAAMPLTVPVKDEGAPGQSVASAPAQVTSPRCAESISSASPAPIEIAAPKALGASSGGSPMSMPPFPSEPFRKTRTVYFFRYGASSAKSAAPRRSLAARAWCQ